MKKPLSISLTGPKAYALLLLWLILAYFAGKFILTAALPYYGFSDEVFGRFLDFRWALIGHITGGMIAIVIGPFQFWKSLRDNYRHVHRFMGKTYMISILIGALSATYLAWNSGLAIHWSWAVALQGMSIAWIVTAGMAYRFIRMKKIEQHKRWVIRSYVVTFAFVTFRFINELPAVQALGEFVERGPTEIWIAWTVPLLITEIILQWNNK